MALLALAGFRLARPNATRSAAALPPGVLNTSRESLSQTIASMEARLVESPTDSKAAVRLADALLRQARVLNHGGPARRAEAVLDVVIAANSSDYAARRMRATVYLSLHRFSDAILEAGRCRALRGDDPWIDGILGDASLELGDRQTAFDAFDRMMARKPDAAAYARVSYARELQGDLPGAIRLMAMAAEATGAQDPEAQAWHAAQLGHLLLASRDFPGARREYNRADALFPGHPFADVGLARVELAEGRPDLALERLNRRLAKSPSAEDLALAGDAHAALGHADEAERHYQLAEAAWTSDTPDPAQLARFRASHGRPAPGTKPR